MINLDTNPEAIEAFVLGIHQALKLCTTADLEINNAEMEATVRGQDVYVTACVRKGEDTSFVHITPSCCPRQYVPADGEYGDLIQHVRPLDGFAAVMSASVMVQLLKRGNFSIR